MMRARSFVFWSALAALTACTPAPADPTPDLDAGSGTPDSGLDPEPADCVEPDVGTVDEDVSEPDDSALVRRVHELARAGQSIATSAFPRETAVRIAIDIDEGAIRTTADGSTYAELDIDGTTVHVVNSGSPTARPTPSDLALHIGSRELLGASIVASFTETTRGFELSLSSIDASGAPARPVGPPSRTLPPGCLTTAFQGLAPQIPRDMPPIRLPVLTGCEDLTRCSQIRAAWARAHIETFWAYLLVEWLETRSFADREFAWGAQGRDVHGELTAPTVAPEWWYGEYDTGRFERVHEGVEDVWRVFRTMKHGRQTVRLYCPPAGETNVCNIGSPPSAHHFDRGELNICTRFFTEHDADSRIRLMIHEPLHWMFVGGVALLDTHTHGHGSNCLTDVAEPQPIYGAEAAHELATYVALNGNDCLHRDIASRAVDVYAQMIHHFGRAVRTREMVRWPSSGDPPPAPCDVAGEEGCICDQVPSTGAPDGDYLPTQFCPDHEGEMTCVTTTFSASTTVGVCTRCQPAGDGGNNRPAGCECESDEQCAIGLSCYGADTQGGGGLGHCYRDDRGPPDFACVADCRRLFNDPQAVCIHDYPGGARCFELACDDPDAFAPCYENGTGVCRTACDPEGNDCETGCGSECVTDAQCDERGYPAGYSCVGAVCTFTGT
ncbi:hypothetical protein [Sandaracinus amylolyticus]|uniref:hypothetical protein n=1 Tax=Sandaracinus amylolyticus TaxID=927083 RepID=UPI001F300914|nr:hypothetical protein [Sandaracinus amylolyticus]UJR78514.1 Hypothetical protein I5071_5440 [Sandaracinus amylolyticus]